MAGLATMPLSIVVLSAVGAAVLAVVCVVEVARLMRDSRAEED